MTGPFEHPPEAVWVGGGQVAIDSDFRLFVAFETAVLREDQNAPAELLARFYLGEVPSNLAAVNAFLNFYRCGDRERSESGPPSQQSRRCYDFEQDTEVLYCSFLEAYHIDLYADRLHWWNFRKLMFGLPADTPFMTRLHYRTADTSGMSRGEKKRYAELKKKFAIQGKPGSSPMTLAERDAWMKDYADRRFKEYAAKGG